MNLERNPLLALVMLFWGMLVPSSGLLFAQHDWTWTFGDSVMMHFPGGGIASCQSLGKLAKYLGDGCLLFRFIWGYGGICKQ